MRSILFLDLSEMHTGPPQTFQVETSGEARGAENWKVVLVAAG